MIRPGDIVIIIAAIALIGGIGGGIRSAETAHTLRITHSGSQEEHAAWRDQRIRVRGPLGETVVEVRNGRARIVSSPCRQKLCIRSGWLESANTATACLPNRVSLLLFGGDSHFDAVNF